CFLAFALFQMRTRTIGEVLWSAAFIISPPIILGFNRGNADLLVFILLSATIPCLIADRPLVRWLAVATILLAAGLKFYPIAAAFVLLWPQGSERERWLELGATGVLTIVLAVTERESLGSFMNDAQSPSGFFTFGFAVSTQLLHLSNETSTILLLLFGF